MQKVPPRTPPQKLLIIATVILWFPGSAWESMSSGLCPVYTQILPLTEAEPPHEAFPGGAWERETTNPHDVAVTTGKERAAVESGATNLGFVRSVSDSYESPLMGEIGTLVGADLCVCPGAHAGAPLPSGCHFFESEMLLMVFPLFGHELISSRLSDNISA